MIAVSTVRRYFLQVGPGFCICSLVLHCTCPAEPAGRADEATFTNATCELYCGWVPLLQIFGLIIFLLFTLWYLLLGSSCRSREARRSRAFITATHVHYRRKRYTCGCLCGGEEVLSVPLLNVVSVLSDASWWSLMENFPACGCCVRPCCATKVPNSDCMLLGVMHRPVGAVDRRSGNSQSQGGLLELPALEDPITFQQVLQAAVMMRQKGEHAVRSGFNDVLSDAVCASVPAGSAEEQAAAAEMLQFDPARAMASYMQASREGSSLSRIRYPKLQTSAIFTQGLTLNQTAMGMEGSRMTPQQLAAVQRAQSQSAGATYPGTAHAAAHHNTGAHSAAAPSAAAPGYHASVAPEAYGGTSAYPGISGYPGMQPAHAGKGMV